jgi:hypothetical protein
LLKSSFFLLKGSFLLLESRRELLEDSHNIGIGVHVASLSSFLRLKRGGTREREGNENYAHSNGYCPERLNF